MARLNIEDQFWIEIGSVSLKFGDQDRAIGNAIRFFRFAQEIHKQGKLISESDFFNNGFSENLFPIFAERVEGGIQSRGAEKFFSWLRSKSEAGRIGGEKSAEKRREKYGSAQPKHKKPRSTPEADSNESSTPEASPSSSNINNNNNRKKPEIVEFNTDQELIAAIPEKKMATWVKLYENDTAFITRELIKAYDYYTDPGQTKPTTMRGWLQALSSWLERSWNFKPAKPSANTVHLKTGQEDYWGKEADYFIKILKSTSEFEGEKIKEAMGPERFEWWCRIGRNRIREFANRPDKWARLDLAKLIKQTYEQTLSEGA